jgi:hypothetical protein
MQSLLLMQSQLSTLLLLPLRLLPRPCRFADADADKGSNIFTSCARENRHAALALANNYTITLARERASRVETEFVRRRVREKWRESGERELNYNNFNIATINK